MGRKAEAIREGEKGLAMALNRLGTPYARMQLVRTYLRTGEPAAPPVASTGTIMQISRDVAPPNG
jgi:hypothetical protein